MNTFAHTLLISAVVLAAPALLQNLVQPLAAATKAAGGANLGSAQLYARVRDSGTIDDTASKGVLPCPGPGGSCSDGPGLYTIPFAREVRNCGISATIGSDGTYYAVPAIIVASTSAIYPHNVHVTTMRESGGALAYYDLDFRLVVIC